MTRPFISVPFSLTLILLAAASVTPCARAMELISAGEDGSYVNGTLAMNEHRWSDAIASFDRVVDAKGKKADAALYWKAYSLNKLGKGPMAMATCFQLRSRYTESQWNRDCSALTIELRSEMKMPVLAVPPVPMIGPIEIHDVYRDEGGPARGSNDDLKMLALNSMLNRDPVQAIPLLRGVLSGNQPNGIKQHAIFVLAQSKSPEAQNILHDAVTGKMGSDLQRQAIQMTAVFQGKRANDSLAEVYRTTSDTQIKRSIISAFFISQDAPRMVELARNEKDLEMKRSIVSQLAIMPDKAATDYMLELLR